jgi:large subunit ribosomal protein L10
MSRKLKELTVKEMTREFADVGRKGCVLVTFSGLSAPEACALRETLAKQGAEMKVIRNRLFAIAMKELGVSEIERFLKGPTAVITGTDVVVTAKAAGDAARTTPSIKLTGGYAEGRLLEVAEVERLASLPTRSVLLSQTLTCIVSPAQRFVNGLSGMMSRFAVVLNQVKEKKEKEQGAAPPPA